MLQYIVSFIKKYKSEIIFSSVITANIVSGRIIINGIINSIYLCYLYKNNKVSTFLNDAVTNILQFKMYMQSCKKNKGFTLTNVLLYIDLKTSYNVYNYFKKKDVKVLNDQLIDTILIHNKIVTNYSNNIRLKLFFTYDGKEYILYHTYNGNTISYPPYSEEIINKYRSDIVNPYYQEKKKGKSFYSLLSMSSKDISIVKINDIASDRMKKYIESIQTPFHDFGMLYNMPVKLEWVISENNIADFSTLYVLFLNLYFDEENMELKDHEIFMTKDDIKKNICSEIINDFLEKM